MKGDSASFLNLLKATRFRRSLPIIMVALIFPAYMNTFSADIIILLITITSIYSISSIFNAHKDNDYALPSYFKICVIAGIAATLTLASLNITILITAIFAIFLGYLYNTISRYIILGDGTIAGLTHYALPLISSAILVGINPLKTPAIPIFYFFMICMIPLTNLKDISKDKTLGYKTLVNSVKNPHWIATAFFNTAFILIFLIYFIFKINLFFLIPLFILQSFTTYMIHKNSKIALNLARIYFLLSFIILIFTITNIQPIKLISGAIFITYLTIFITNLKDLARDNG